MSQKTLGDRILSIVVGTLGSLVPSGVSSALDGVVDFAYVRVLGLPFIVLGYRQSGKTTLLEWLRRETAYLGDFDPDPTAAGGDAIGAFGARVGEDVMRLKPRRDVGGEYAMWETDWVDLFREAKPRGIIFMMDHTNPYQHKDALNFTLQMIDEDPGARKNLKMFMVLVNKADLWEEGSTLEVLMDDYRNEVRRMKSQAERLNYFYLITGTSLLNGTGVDSAMTKFFNAIRPRPRKDTPLP
ncbi:MAG: hypothetical protein JXN59_14750 [Anaerolineae bacterium]|nr:hypothetical protein [Anaerolineae bacterium]